MHKKEKDPKAANRLLVYIKRKDGLSIRQICAQMNISYSTIRDWLVRAVAGGLDYRYDEVRPGPQGKLDDRQLEQLKKELIAGPRSCGYESGLWTGPLLADHIRKEYGVQYIANSVREMMHRMGFSCKKPRPRHPKSASELQKKAFKKKQKTRQGTMPKKDTLSLQKTSHRTS